MPTTAFAFLTKNPCRTLINFAEKLYDKHNMDVYLIIDNCEQYYDKSDKIFYIQLRQLRSTVSLWNKAIHYFRDVQSYYDYVWIISEDVFVSSDSALKVIDEAYPLYDLLIPKDDCLPIPPACRISRRLMQFLNDNNSKEIEVIAILNKYAVFYPAELSTIKKRARWTLNDIKRKKNHLYFPVGNYEEHELYRHYDPNKSYILY